MNGGRTTTSKAFYIVDPLDRWIRLTLCSEIYHEPLQSLHDLAKERGIALRYNGRIAYINEREYQDALGKLPDAPPARRNVRDPKKRPDPVPWEGERRPRLRKSEADAS